MNDRYSGLRQPAGRRVVGGDQALAYVRARRDMGGDGSDLARVENQQRFMAAMLARAGERLADPARLYAFLRAVDKFVDRDAELDLKTMYDIARSVKATGPGGAEFVTVPWREHRPDPNRIELNRGAAERLFAELRSDTP